MKNLSEIITCFHFPGLPQFLKSIIVIFLFHSAGFVQANQTSSLDELLELPLDQLMEITIATRTPRKIDDVTGTVYVYTQSEIQKHGWLYLSDLVQHIPGVDVANNGSGVFLSSRGVVDKTSQGNKTVVMIDGHNTSFSTSNSPGFLGFNYQYSLAGVKQVEVLVGSGSTLHGANAFNLVIDLISKTPDDVEGVEASFAYGSNQVYNPTLTGSFQSGKWSGFATGSYYKQDQSELAEIEVSQVPGMEYYDNDTFGENYYGNYDIHAYINYTNNLRVGGRISKVDSGFGTFYLTTKQGRKVVDQEMVYLDWSNQIDEQWSYNLKSHYKQSELDDNTFRRELEGSRDRFGAINSGSNSLVFDNQFIFEPSLNYTLLFGVFYEKSTQRDNVAPTFPNTVPQPELENGQERNWDNYAIYAQSEWTVNDDLYTVLGVRVVDSKEQFDSEILPRLGVKYTISKIWSTAFNYQRGYRPPSALEKYPTAGFLQVNPDLRPEIIDTYELSFTGKINSRNQTRTTLYYSDVTDLIVRSPTGLSPPDPTAIDENIGNLSIYGLEVSYKWIASPRLTINTVYMFTDSYNETEKQNTQNIVRNKLNLSLSFKLATDWDLTWDNYYNHDPQTHADHPIYQGQDADSWLLSNLTVLTKKLFDVPTLSGSLTIQNLFDEKYGIECRCGAGRNPGISLINSQQRRSALLAVRYHF